MRRYTIPRTGALPASSTMPGRNPAAAIKYGNHHQQLAARLRARLIPGTPCPQQFPDGSVCGQPMWPSQRLALGHRPDGGYLGLVHARCNESDGGQRLALAQGKQLRKRTCPVCGRRFKASRRDQVTCGWQACITAIRRGEPSQPSGRSW
jgi:hypothetical protein